MLTKFYDVIWRHLTIGTGDGPSTDAANLLDE